MSPVPYYWVNPKNNRAYWKPNKRMMGHGFGSVALGYAGPEAEALAQQWTERHRAARREDPLALGARLSSRTDEQQYVYFLQVTDRIKIGASKRPFLRLQDLAAGAHGPVGRVVVVRGTPRDEKRLHDRFSAYRSGGEWFVASRPLILTMGRCASAGVVVHDGTDGASGVESHRVKESNREGEKVPKSLKKLARETGLEPAASAVTGRRSNQLSYSRGCRNLRLIRAGMRA